MWTRLTRLFPRLVAGMACIGSQTAVAIPPPLPVVLSDISLNLAVQGSQAAVEACNKIDEKITVAVVDRLEHIRVLMVSNGLGGDWLSVVQDGAHTVLKTGMSSGDYVKTFDFGGPNSDLHTSKFQKLSEARKADPHLSFIPGAVPITRAGVIVGAVSVAGTRGYKEGSGYEYRGPVEPCAIAGRDKIEAGF